MTPYEPDVILKQINFRILSDRDRLDILEHIITVLTTFAGNDPYLDKVNAALMIINDGLYSASTKDHVHADTKTINELHESRICAIAKMYDGISFFEGDDDADLINAAKLMERLLNKHFQKLDDSKKRTLTAAINEFFKDAAESKYVAAIDKILLAKRVIKLKDIQDEMIMLLNKRAEEEELDTTPNLVPVRDDMLHFVTALQKILWINVALKEPGMSELVHKLNGRIGQIMSTARTIHTLGENGHLSEDSKPEPETEEEDLEPVDHEESEDPMVEEPELEESEEKESEEIFTRDDR